MSLLRGMTQRLLMTSLGLCQEGGPTVLHCSFRGSVRMWGLCSHCRQITLSSFPGISAYIDNHHSSGTSLLQVWAHTTFREQAMAPARSSARPGHAGRAIALDTTQGQSTAAAKGSQEHALRTALTSEGGGIPELEAAFA